MALPKEWGHAMPPLAEAWAYFNQRRNEFVVERLAKRVLFTLLNQLPSSLAYFQDSWGNLYGRTNGDQKHWEDRFTQALSSDLGISPEESYDRVATTLIQMYQYPFVYSHCVRGGHSRSYSCNFPFQGFTLASEKWRASPFLRSALGIHLIQQVSICDEHSRLDCCRCSKQFSPEDLQEKHLAADGNLTTCSVCLSKYLMYVDKTFKATRKTKPPRAVAWDAMYSPILPDSAREIFIPDPPTGPIPPTGFEWRRFSSGPRPSQPTARLWPTETTQQANERER